MTGPRALIAVSSQTQGLLLKLLLEEQGIEAVCVERIDGAVADLSLRSADLLLVESGLAGPEEIAELRRRCPAPVILLSGSQVGAGRRDGDAPAIDLADPHAVVREATAILAQRNGPPSAADIFRRARILIVDDSATYREYLRAELEEEGCNVTAARNAEEAVAALDDGGLDCVILDLVMPGTSGTQLCERFDRFRRRRGLFFQIVILTSQDSEDKLMASLTAGADDFVGKAQAMEVLKIRLMALLRRKYFVEDQFLRLSRGPAPS
ncbi:response regulator [Azospirillum sp. SYSU D00513]|uniref:response regulator transcription factor n=1 Tax=Azospirillum sp. SYSU D00513 TaxID=2812561 RepID=UPI001A97B65D|nr:response regulator [Azospirillum sp. SYSU D00513]